MTKTTREKVALIVFAILIVFTGVVLISYFSTGRSWTIAATFVDDTMGGLDGYTAVVFNGVIDPDDYPELMESSKDNSSDSKSSGSISSNYQSIDTSSDEKQKEMDQIEVLSGDNSGVSMIDPSKSIGLRILSIYPRMIHEEREGVLVSDVRDLYERKGADAITLNLSRFDEYQPYVLFKTPTKKIGIFSVETYENKKDLNSITDTLKVKGADVIICVTKRLSLVSTYKDMNVVITCEPITASSKHLVEHAKDNESTLILESPEIGDVGVVILSPNNTCAARLVDAL